MCKKWRRVDASTYAMFHPDALDFDGRVERRKAFLKSHPDAHERMEVWYAQTTSASQSEAIGFDVEDLAQFFPEADIQDLAQIDPGLLEFCMDWCGQRDRNVLLGDRFHVGL